MTRFKKILVPVDLSPRSIGAARYAAALGSRFNSELVFVHAIRDGWPLSGPAMDVRDAIAEIRGCAASRFLFREGEPVPVILDAAGAESADLILMPTRGVPVLYSLFDGSITAQVLRTAPCPVWAGVDDMSPLAWKPIRTILCGLSLGPRTSSVLGWASGLARELHAALTVVHTSRSMQSNPGYPCDGEWRLWLSKMTRDDIRALQKSTGSAGDVRLEPGPPQVAIPSAVKSLRADLLVIGKSPKRRLLGDLRTLSYDIVCRTRCPVASV